MFNRYLITGLVILAYTGLITGCSANKSDVPELPAAQQRPHNSKAQVRSVVVPRDAFAAATRNIDQIRKLRLIEVMGSEGGGQSPFPEYRLFNVLPGSAYDLLGLEDGDILISANDFALNDPERFRQYVQVLYQEPGETFVEIRRNGEEIILKFSFES